MGLLASLPACGSDGPPPPAGSAGFSGSALGGSAGAGVPAGGTAGGGGTAPPGGDAGSTAAGGGSGSSGSAPFVLTSPALDHVDGCSVDNPRVCDVFPDSNVSYMGNANISPELRWTGAPAGTKSFAVVLFDVTYGQAHWALWNIPGDATHVAADVPRDTATPATPAGSRQANANFAPAGGDGYFGPHLPCNVFELQLYALSSSSFDPGAPDSAVLVSIELQDLGETVLGVAKLAGRSNDYMMACE